MEEEGVIGERKKVSGTKYVVTYYPKMDRMVIRRFIPSIKRHRLNYPSYLAIDSDDQKFVADRGKDRIVSLESDLKCNRIICPTKQEEGIKTHFQRICYDDEKKQLI